MIIYSKREWHHFLFIKYIQVPKRIRAVEPVWAKKDSETLNEDKSLVKSNTNKNVAVESAKKATRPKNVIRRETQAKLIQL